MIVFFSTSKVMRPLPPPSSMMMRPLSSSNTIREPARDLMTRRSFLPSFLSAGASLPFHSAPMTTGWLMSPCSNITTTSSSTSGMKNQPRFLPAPGDTTGAHQVASVALSTGMRTWTRPSFSGSRLLVTTPMTAEPRRSAWAAPRCRCRNSSEARADMG
ncbi:MAG: hypothetical protein R2939_18265 [Kofleriaceae bacterium]